MDYTVKKILGLSDRIEQAVPFFNQKLDECWGSSLDYYNTKKEGDKESIAFGFNNNGEKYKVILRNQNNNGDFKGDIFCNEEKAGTCFFTVYKNPTRTLLWGEWKEEGFRWVTLIELIK